MIRTRFAPSPTGYLHIGGLRTAAYAYALAKHSQGEFLLRIEDTDKKREVKGAVEALQSTLLTFGLVWDEEYVQSERQKTGIYQQAAEALISAGHAYKDEGAIRIKIPKGEEIGYHDFVLDKDINWKTDILQDMVLLKSDGFPTYHLASVVDDHDMNISHILRGHDWLPSTPIHLLLYKFLNYPLPHIGHLTDILDPQGGKLSKRKGAASCEELLLKGYLPEAILNFVILLGWAPKDNREMFTLAEFVDNFDIGGFQKSNPVLNLKKLDWFNGQYLRRKSDDELLQRIKPLLEYETTDEKLQQIIPLVKERVTTLADMVDMVRFFFVAPEPQSVNQQHIKTAEEVLHNCPWIKNDIETNLQQAVKSHDWKTGDFFMNLRLAICGSRVTPPLTESMLILGKDEVLSRLKSAHAASKED